MIPSVRGLLTGWAVENKQPVIITDNLTDPRWMNRTWEEEEGLSRTALVVPCMVKDEVMGVLALSRPSDRPYTTSDLERLSKLPIKLTP